MDSTRESNAVAPTDSHSISQRPCSQATEEKYRDQFTGFALETGRVVISSIKDNAGDYKVISEDMNLSPVDKALVKRKFLAADIGLVMLVSCGTLWLVWLAKKVFVA